MAITTGSLIVVQNADTTLILTARESDGSVMDISAATEIVWAMFEDAAMDEAAVVTKKLSLSEISRPGGGSDGVLHVTIDHTDTDGIDPGTYEYQVLCFIGSKYRVCRSGTLTLESSADMVALA